MKRAVSIVFVLVLALAAACRNDSGSDPASSDGGPDDSTVDGAPGCESTEGCDDGLACTVDSCEVGGQCAHQGVDELCEPGEVCNLDGGCTAAGCVDDTSCEDTLECTIDICGIDLSCTHRAVDDLCGEGMRCELGTGCVQSSCTEASQCDDSIDCTEDICDETFECRAVPRNDLCPEGEHCVPGLGCLEGECDDASDCDDGVFCNGDERCGEEFGCLAAESHRDCDDGEACTIDSCDTELDLCAYSVNSELAGCDEVDPEHLSGCFTLSTTIHQACGLGTVNYTFDQVCFEMTGPILTITAGPYALSQNPATDDGTFATEHVVSGGCTETYSLSGSFTSADVFSGMWSATYVAVDGISCLLGMCPGQSIPVTGTRIP